MGFAAPPQVRLKPGKSLTFGVAYGVKSEKSLTVAVTPGERTTVHFVR